MLKEIPVARARKLGHEMEMVETTPKLLCGLAIESGVGHFRYRALMSLPVEAVELAHFHESFALPFLLELA